VTVEEDVGASPGSATFTVTLSSASGMPVTVDFATVDGTAIAGDDYVATNGTLTFAPGETSKSITIAMLNDSFIEPDEMFGVNLSNATNATISDGHGRGTITDDDLTPTLNIDSVTVVEGNSGTRNIVFTVRLDRDPLNVIANLSDVTVNYTTANRTATAGSDYVAKSGTLTFAAGSTDVSQTITVTINGDTVFESDETFVVFLNGADNAVIDWREGVGTIINDDSAP